MINVIESGQLAKIKVDGSALIGDLLVFEGKLSETDVHRIVTLQRHEGLRFGEAALQLGLVSGDDVDRALALQFDYPYFRGDISLLDRRLIVAYDSESPSAEVFRSLRSELMLRWFAKHQKCLAVVGPRGLEGSSIVAANLAVAFAQLGERTLLIDANLRSPVQQTLFGVAQSGGLSALLGGRAALKQVLQRVAPFERLSLLCAGPLVPNPQELLARDTFANLLESVPSKFDVVVVDTPPVLSCADAQVIAARAGGCLFVARRHQTRVRDLRSAALNLVPSGAELLGTVISD